uniref:26S proteasome non-ATPase regulatory subunit 5 n=1 Tax=Parastrongyloides trichosuri TaxID=131310 RepID=A0A0N4ZSX3_PARTI
MMKDINIITFEKIDDIDFSQNSNVWTEEGLRKATKIFKEYGSEDSAINILEKLLKIDVSEVPTVIIPLVQDFVCEVLKTISMESIVNKYQMTLVLFINQCPHEILRVIINKYFMPQLNTDIINILSTSGRAIVVALSRRLYKSPIVETIAEMVRHFIKCPEVMMELEYKLNDENSQRRFEIHTVTKAVILNNDETEFPLIDNLISALLKELEEDDILSALAALTMLTEITSQREGASVYLNKKGTIKRIYEILSHSKKDGNYSLLYFGCIKFFGHLISVNINHLNEYPVFIQSILGMFLNFDGLNNEEKILAISTFGATFHSRESKKYLLLIEEIKMYLINIMRTYKNFLTYADQTTRIHIFDALVMLFEGFSMEEENIFKELFDSFGTNFPNMLLDFLKSPFEIRFIAQHLLQRIIEVPYGFEKIYFTPGFFDYLLDRKTETNSVGMQTKYDIICTIVQKYYDVLGDTNTEKLKDYIKKGSCYNEFVPELVVMR